MFAVAIQAATAVEAVEQIAQAEAAGVDGAWATMGGAGGVDMIPVFAAAAMRTARIRLGTAIVHTWPRHPIVLAQEAMAIEQLAPGRFRLGIGPTSAVLASRMYGLEYRRPLTQLREYLVSVRALLHEGSVDFEGELVTVRGQLRTPSPIPVMASALRPKSYELCGEVADGAISWMNPLRYLVEVALPAMARGAESASRPVPPLVAHVPIAVTSDRGAARALARTQLAMYARVPNYQGMFAAAGYDVAEGYSDALLDDLVVSGTEAEVAAGLHRWRDAGMSEVLAHPLLDPEDRAGSIARAFAAVATAAG
ncbi:MAG: LLM class flavin-dependent oxidoreductase [Dehalococcoidia bacterium]